MKDLPVEIESVGGNFNLNSILLLGESNAQVSSNIGVSTITTVTANTNIIFGSGLVTRPGRVIIVTSISMTLNGSGRVSFEGTSDGSWSTWLGAVPPFNKNVYASFGVNGGSITHNFPQGLLIPEAYTVFYNYQSTDTTSRVPSITVTYHELTADFNFKAKYKLLVTGDSTTWYPMGNDENNRAYFGKWLWPFQLVDLLKTNDKIDVRLISRSYGGALATDTYYNLESSAYSLIEWDFKIVSLGHNDSLIATATPQAKFKESLFSHILDRNRNHPGKPILFLGLSTTDDTLRAANSATYRQWIKEVANDATLGGIANNVYYYDQSKAYGLNATATTDTNFRTTERNAGGRLHPSGIGHTLLASNTNADSDNSINAGQQSGIYGVVKKYKNQIFKP